jgi:NDP-sugar pyrophosphorylase family protein
MQCMILAGGRGTRLGELGRSRPKNLVMVLGRPFADLQLDWLAAQGVSDVLYSIGHHGSQIAQYVGGGERFGLTVRYSDEGHDLRGTGGAIRLAYDRGLLEPRFLVLYGDSYLRIDLQQLWNSAAASGAPMTMAVFENNGAHERSNVWFENGRVRLYDKHASGRSARRMGHIDYGVSVLDRSVAERIPLGVYDLAELQHELSTSGEVAGYEVQDRYFEVGTPEGIAELEAFLSRTREKR